MKKDWGLAVGLEPRLLFKGRAVRTPDRLFKYQEQRGGLSGPSSPSPCPLPPGAAAVPAWLAGRR